MSGFAVGASEFVPGKGLVRSPSPTTGPSAQEPEVAVPPEAITQLDAAWTSLVSGSTADQSSGLASLVSLLQEHGPALLVCSNTINGSSQSLLQGMRTALDNDGPKSGLPKAKLGALAAVKGLAEGVGVWFEPYAVGLLRGVLAAFKGAKIVIAAAEAAAKAVIGTMSAHGVRPVLSVLFEGMGAYEWQVKEGAIALLEQATHVLRSKEEIAKMFPEVILKLIESLGDTRPAVRQAALKVFPQVCTVVENPDVNGIIPIVIKAYAEPEKTGTALDALSACSFINVVDAPTLGLILPVLLRGMKERRVLTKRKCAIIIYNMCKLVADPRDAVHFYPVLKPVLERAVDEVTNEDVRDLCERALAKLVEVKGSLADEAEYADEKAKALPMLRRAVQKYGGFRGGSLACFEELIDYVASLGASLMHLCILDPLEWSSVAVPYLSAIMPPAKAEEATTSFMNHCISGLEATSSDAGTDEGEDVVNVEFSLGYGGKILLHQARLWLKRGHRYGIVGKNGCGKTTLMRNIANGSLDGLPEGLRTVYVESNPASHLETPVVEFVVADASLPQGTARKAVVDMLTEVGFTAELQQAPLNSLSGGWRMKLALAQAMLSKPDLLLLDEPTNHLDVNAVKWLTDYVQGLKTVTVLVVSHSTTFLDDICTNIIHYENQKLVTYHGNLSTFVRQRPEAKHYYELSTDSLVFNFPVPGRLDGVTSRTQAIIKMEDVTFTYPGSTKPQLRNVTLRLSRVSRVAVVGANGAGKSTLIKLLVGETSPDLGTGEVWKHHNLRVAYVAQHSFHHLEQHVEQSPVEYIQWRFAKGVDKEILEKETMALSEEEQKKLKSDRYGAVEELRNRRTRGGVLEYEVKFVGMHERENKYLTKEQLEAMGFSNLVKQADERVAAEAAGLDIRQLTTKEVQGHLNDFGLDQEFGTYGKIGGLSGGQKVKLVLAAAMWNCPHLLVLDEPTNFLDREALGAFATAIKEFQGGVIMISHDREFIGALCTETWLVEDGEVDVVEEEMVEGKIVHKKKAKKVEEDTDEVKLLSAGGNTNKGKDTSKIERDFWGKPLSKAELRRRAKEEKDKARAAKK